MSFGRTVPAAGSRRLRIAHAQLRRRRLSEAATFGFDGVGAQQEACVFASRGNRQSAFTDPQRHAGIRNTENACRFLLGQITRQFCRHGHAGSPLTARTIGGCRCAQGQGYAYFHPAVVHRWMSVLIDWSRVAGQALSKVCFGEIVVQQPEKPIWLSEAELVSLTGISHRNLTHSRQEGLIKAIEPRHGLGYGPGSTQLEYSNVEVFKINRLNEYRHEFKNLFEWRWRLWLYDDPNVRIAPDLADTLDREGDRFRGAGRIKNLDDVETICAGYWKSTDIPRGNLLRKTFKGLNREEMHAVMTMFFCILHGIRLPFDRPNALPLQVFKCVFGLPEELQMPPDLFDVFPHAHEQIVQGLRTAEPRDLKGARKMCRFLDRVLDNPEISKRDAAIIAKVGVPEQAILFVASAW
jgi:hypothetical protein